MIYELKTQLFLTSKMTNQLHVRVECRSKLASTSKRGNELLQAEAALSEVEAPETDRNRRLLWAVISPFKSGFCSDTSEKLP